MGLADLDADALMARMTELGVVLRAEGDSLCYDAPSAVATPELLAALRAHREPLLARIRAGVRRRGPVTLQQRAFAAAKDELGLPEVYNVAMRFTFDGPLNVAALEKALSALVARHETLRTRYVLAGDQWWQEVLVPRAAGLAVRDLAGLPPGAREAEVGRVSAGLAGTRFDLTAGTWPVARLLRTGQRRWVLVWVLHHVCCDGWGLSVLLRDLAALYAAADTGRPDGLGRPVQPIEYALWQRENPIGTQDKLAYWSRQFEGTPFGVDLPMDRPRPAELSGRGDIMFFELPANMRSQIEAYARRRRTTPFAVTAAAFGVLLSRLSGQGDIVVGVPYANRERRAHENLAACAAVNFVLRIKVAQAESFDALVDAVSRDTIDAISNIMPLGQVAARIGRERVPNRMTVGFQYQNTLETEIEFPGLTVAIEDLAIRAARTEFIAGLVPTADTLSVYAEYSSDLWDGETIERWMAAYRELLCEVVEGRVDIGRSAAAS